MQLRIKNKKSRSIYKVELPYYYELFDDGFMLYAKVDQDKVTELRISFRFENLDENEFKVEVKKFNFKDNDIYFITGSESSEKSFYMANQIIITYLLTGGAINDDNYLNKALSDVRTNTFRKLIRIH